MRNGHKVIDVDSHVMEPDDLFEHYLEAPFRAYAPKTTRFAMDQLQYFCRIEVGGHVWFGDEGDWDVHPFIRDGAGGMQTYKEAYRDYIEQLARERPVVLVWENLHWADSRSLEILESLASLTAAAPAI